MGEELPAVPDRTPPAAGPRLRERLSAAFTALCGVVFLLFVGFLIWIQVGASVLDTVPDPERALALIADRTLDLGDGMRRAAAWERRFYELAVGESAEDLPQVIAWYDELARVSFDPGVELRLAVLRAEAGELAAVAETVAAWRVRGPPFDTLAALLDAAYFDGAVSAAPDPADVLPAGWVLDHLRERLADRTGDTAARDAARGDAAARGRALLGRMRLLVVAHLAVLGAGIVAAAALVRRRRRVRVARAPQPPAWSGRDGATVLVRGGAFAAILILTLVPVGPWGGAAGALADALAVPMALVPMLLMARRRLWRPPGEGAIAALGIVPDGRAGWRALGLVTLALVAAGIAVDLAIGLVGELGQVDSHWSEWFDAELAWGGRTTVAAALFGAVVLAPVFEEIVFRGLLYGTLRRRYAWPLAAALSASVFAVAHGYGAAGFASVFVSGLLWALAYERTGSLVPAIAAHAANNLAASAAILLLLR